MVLIKRPVRKAEKGQGFVELALSIVFLLVLLSAVIDLGWAFFTLIALRDSAQEAATYAAICPKAGSGENSFTRIKKRFLLSASSPIDMNRIEPERIAVRIFKINADGTTTDLCTMTEASQACAATPAIGDSVEFKVTYDHQIMTPFVGAFIGRETYPLEVTTVDTLLSDACSNLDIP